MRTSSSRSSPAPASKRGRRARPLSITTPRPSTVNDDSARFVDRITRPAAVALRGASTRSWAVASRSPCSVTISSLSRLAGPRPKASSARAISPLPGKKTSMSRPTAGSSAGCARSQLEAASTARTTCASSASRPRGAWYATSIGNSLPGASTTAASRNPTSGPGSIVADSTTIFRSGRASSCTRCASASPKSPSRWRSWNSSNTTHPTPSRNGSPRTCRKNTPSVTAHTRVFAETFLSKRTR